MAKCFIVCVLLFCVSLIGVHAANLSNYYTSDNGLLNNNVSCIMQDRKGYVWMGTSDGVLRFNGYEFTSFFHSDDDSTCIIGAEILDIYQDRHSNIWISTALGLSCFDAKTQCFRNFMAFRDGRNTYSNYITGVLEASDTSLWVATSYGIHLFNPRSGTFRIFTFQHNTLSESDANYVRKMVMDKNGNLWLGLINGELIYFNTKNYSFRFCTHHTEKTTASKFDLRLTALLVDHQNEVWAGFRNRGLVCYSSSGTLLRELTYQNKALPSNSILCLSESENKSLLVGTNGNGVLSIAKGQAYCAANEFRQIRNNKVSSLFCDRQQNYWLAYVSAGVEVFYSQYNRFVSNDLFKPLGEKSTTVLDVCIDHRNRLWLACDAAGLYCIDRSSGTTTHYFTELKNNFPATNEAVTAVHEDQQGTIWVGSYVGGLSAIQPSGTIINYRNQANNAQSIAGNSIKDITSDRNGNIWLAIDNRGFSMLTPKNKRFVNYNIDSLFGTSWKNWVYNIIHRDSVVLVTTNDGIVVYNLLTGKARNYLADSDVKNQYRIGVTSYAYFDSRSRLWVASKNGLLQFDLHNNKLAVYSVKNGFSANAISSIVEDATGCLWLGTFRGLIRFNPETKQVNNFTIQDGLQSNQFNYGACYRSQQGELVFGGTNGYSSFFAQNIRLNPFTPNVDITAFRISNNEIRSGKDSPLKYDISNTDSIVLQHNQSNIGFSFSALNLIQSDKNQYAYKLEGFDNDWIQAGTSRTANYTNLPSGQYVFTVKASNNDGLWNTAGRSIYIVIQPPFWRTAWAYALYALLLIVLLYVFRRYSLISINEKHRLQLESIEKEKQDEIHRNKLEFFTEISHEIRTPLILIIDPIERHLDANADISTSQLKSIYTNIKKLHTLVNQLLDFRKIEASPSMHYTQSDFVAFLQNCISSFEAYSHEKQINLQFQSSFEQFSFLFDAEKMETILTNLLSNALKHTPPTGNIRVLLSGNEIQHTPQLNLVVENTGKGIAPEHLANLFNSFYKADTYTEGSGLGLAIVKALVELHNGTIAVECLDNSIVRFSMLFPVLQDDAVAVNTANLTTPSSDDDVQKPILLLAEDTLEVRRYICSIFAQSFQIIEAANGEEAWRKSHDTIPDIIISDVMMPVMDGRILCEKLKADKLTNHIPVILLTAQTLDTQKLAGLASGADDYICKPFRSRELELKVQNLLATQNNLKQRLQQQYLLVDESNEPSSRNDEFLSQAHAVIQQHLAESSFDVEQFAAAMCISSRQLRRKLQATIGLSPVEMLRNARLQAALKLLKQHKYQVAEVAYMLGFDDPKYFSKLFSKQFGVLPSEV